MIYGWLRPDKFPGGARIRKCDDWWDQFRQFSTDPKDLIDIVLEGGYISLDNLKDISGDQCWSAFKPNGSIYENRTSK